MDIGQEVYIGLDTHRETIHGTALKPDGELICSINFPNNPEALKEFMKGFYPWYSHIAIEACNFWNGPYKTLRELGYKIKLANPVKTSQIAKDKKTDEEDSKILADLLRINYLPEIYLPADEIIALRDLTRHKINFMRFRVKIQNKIKAHLSRNGIYYNSKLWNKNGIAWLKGLKDYEIDSYLRFFESAAKEEDSAKRKIEKIAMNKEETALLKTIPGIGYYGAAIIFAEIGDITRFPTPKHLQAYSGFSPGISQSGTKTRMPKRINVNYWLKFIIGQCAGRTTLKKGKLQKHYFKIRKKKGWKTARKSTGRLMLSIIWHVLTEKIPYQES
jgi:transposase